MRRRFLIARLAAAAVATVTMFWLLATVNRHGDDLTRGLLNGLNQSEMSVADARRTSNTNEGGGGLALVDMFQCMCGSNDDVSQWVGWWLIAAVFGGVPTAILVRPVPR